MVDLEMSIIELQGLNTVIFGYVNEHGFPVGSIICPNINKQKTEKMVENATSFLFNLNGLLQDLGNIEIQSATFTLNSLEKKTTSILPEGFCLFLGKYRDRLDYCIALFYEMGQLKLRQAHDNISSICERLYEVEATLNRSGLDFNNQGLPILKKFSNRFANQIMGYLIEKRWSIHFKKASEGLTKNNIIKTPSITELNLQADIYIDGKEIFNYQTNWW